MNRRYRRTLSSGCSESHTRDPVEAAAGSLASLASSGREKESSAACEKRCLHHVDEIRCQPLGSNNAGEDTGRLEVVDVSSMTSRTRRVVSPSTDADPSRPPGTAPCFVAFHRMSRHEDRPTRRFCVNPSSGFSAIARACSGLRFSNRSIEAVGPRRARSIAELTSCRRSSLQIRCAPASSSV